MKYRMHVVAPPHTATSREYSSCAYTDKARKFVNEMTRRGHEVFLYGGHGNEADCKEFISCFTSEQTAKLLGDKHYIQVPLDGSPDVNALWSAYNWKVIEEMEKRLEPRDFILISFGDPNKAVGDQFPNHIVVEYGIGYAGTFAKYRIWESYAWMHMNYTKFAHPMDIDGIWFDAVVPGFFEAQLFPEPTEPRGDYVAYLGRMIDRKGLDVAVQATERAGVKLICAGPGTPPKAAHVKYIGEVGPVDRWKLLSGARALIAPTKYIEPFGNVVIEAQACGTPAITTDWGGFTETVKNAFNGYRCRTLAEFATAIDRAKNLDHKAIRRYAHNHYSAEAVGAKFEEQFDRLYTLWEKGWPQ